MRLVQTQMKNCPFCAETIQAEAIKCRFCGEFLNTRQAAALEAGVQPNEPEETTDEAEDDGILLLIHPSLLGMAGTVIRVAILLGIVIFVLVYPLRDVVNEHFNLDYSESQLMTFAKYKLWTCVIIISLVLLRLIVKMVRLKSIYYEISADRIEWGRGIFDRQVNNIDMFRVVDLRLRRSILDWFFRIGTVTLVTSDKTDPEFSFSKIHKPRELYDIIKKASLDADSQRGVIHLE